MSNAETVTPENPVSDNETLYRAVLNEARFFPSNEQGEYRTSSTAFNDVGRRPSVDRAVLCPDGAEETQRRFRKGSGVLALTAGAVRQIHAAHGGTGQVYTVDVEPVPLLDNPAHAEIFGRPPFDTDRIFDRIKQPLACLTVVIILPEFEASE